MLLCDYTFAVNLMRNVRVFGVLVLMVKSSEDLGSSEFMPRHGICTAMCVLRAQSYKS